MENDINSNNNESSNNTPSFLRPRQSSYHFTSGNPSSSTNTTTTSSSSTTSRNPPNSSSSTSSSSPFECKICLEQASKPIVTPCGHLYCWACLYKWLNLHPDCPSCPTCKSVVDKKKLIPLYTGEDDKPSTSDHQHQQHNKQQEVGGEEEAIPERPRTEPTESARVTNPQTGEGPFPYHMMDGFQAGGFSFSFGMGLFPMFGIQYHGGGGGNNNNPNNPQRGAPPVYVIFFLIFLLMFCTRLFSVQ